MHTNPLPSSRPSFESSDDAIVSKSLEEIITSWNRGAERIFGYSAIEVIGQPITILIPPERLDEEPAILARVQSGERVDHFETVRRRKDGQLIDISLTISPIRTPGGIIVGASKIARDISERQRGQEQQSLLLHEMNYRIKNLFALTGGLLSLAAREAETPGDLVKLMRERLVALARAHDLTLRSHEADPAAAGTISLFALLDAMPAPHKTGNLGSPWRAMMSSLLHRM
ncbi:PAS domain S-box protein [Rhizobium sp. LjRoot30]|uniref:PAS domain S-box protein n=1 Tax=Rhizobium sp. LjRoot30 TaxID=3342320 RepID=UPI003ECFDD5F